MFFFVCLFFLLEQFLLETKYNSLVQEERENNYIYKILFGQTFDYERELEIAEEENEKFNVDNLEELD